MEIHLAYNLKRIRIIKKLTQQRMADILWIDIKTYQAYEYGRNEPPIKKLVQMAQIFNITLEQLLLTKL